MWIKAPKQDFPPRERLWLEVAHIRPCIVQGIDAATTGFLKIAELSPEKFELDRELHDSLFPMISEAYDTTDFPLQSLGWLCIGNAGPKWRDVWAHSRAIREVALNKNVDPFFPYRDRYDRSKVERGYEDLCKLLFSIGVSSLDWQNSDVCRGPTTNHDWPELYNAALQFWHNELSMSGSCDDFWANAVIGLLVRSLLYEQVDGYSDKFEHFVEHALKIWGANLTTVCLLQALEL